MRNRNLNEKEQCGFTILKTKSELLTLLCRETRTAGTIKGSHMRAIGITDFLTLRNVYEYGAFLSLE